MILNLAFYRFVGLEADSLPALRSRLRSECESRGLRGTILISTEGLNGSIAGEEPQARDFMAWMGTQEPFRGLDYKLSLSERIPFGNLFIKIKKEIIPLGMSSIAPERETGARIPAAELKRWLDEKRDIVLVDTRNSFEIGYGTFEGALDLGLKSFRELGGKIRELPVEIKSRPVVMFCTGGIRCEKATALARREGFSEVYQLDGGILRYFEECGSAHYRGSCFVFDERVALKPDLTSEAV